MNPKISIAGLAASLMLSLAAPVAHPADAIACDLSRGRCEALVMDERMRLRLKRAESGYAAKGGYLSEPLDIGKAGPISIRWIEQWTSPQRWNKHPGNPIFGPKQSGAWDKWTNGVAVVRNPDGKSYKMFYAGRGGGGIGFAEAAIDNPLVWKENPASPVLKPRSDNWEGNQINQPRVVKVTEQHWRMYYSGWGLNGKGGSPWTFGLAESHDAGITWVRYGDEPLMERGAAGAPDDGGVFVPEVRRVGQHWMMWYTAMKINNGRQNIHLCLATSEDGIHWTKCEKNPVLTDDFTTGSVRNVLSRCHVRHDDGVFRLWYSHAKPAYRIRYAESLDGIQWEKSPIALALDASPGKSWDSQMVEYPEIDVADGQWRMWFCGNGFGSVGFAEGIVETGVKVSVRSGKSSAPDESWSAWTPATRGAEIPSDRFVQIKAELWSNNPQLSPALNRVEIVR